MKMRDASTEHLSDRFVSQLDGLVAFLAVANKDVFEVVEGHYKDWAGVELPRTSGLFEAQVNNSAFLLGYSYWEAFLADVVREVYTARPQMLPKDRRVKNRDLLGCKDYEAVLQLMIEAEVREVFFKGIEGIQEYCEKRLNLHWAEVDEFKKASLIRNCLMHNMGQANKDLAEVSAWVKGEDIILKAAHVHAFGLKGRQFAKDLYRQVKEQIG